WSWGLGLGKQGLRRVLTKQADVLWKSVEDNLSVKCLWFVRDVGLSWAEMLKVIK
ncbi:unnamed protein product, partial [Choristocarpus tenellus]